MLSVLSEYSKVLVIASLTDQPVLPQVPTPYQTHAQTVLLLGVGAKGLESSDLEVVHG